MNLARSVVCVTFSLLVVISLFGDILVDANDSRDKTTNKYDNTHNNKPNNENKVSLK